jgi:hypothetical protein
MQPGSGFTSGVIMPQTKNTSIRPIFRLNNERKSWDTLYNCTEPSCLGDVSEEFWWLREREPWKRVSAEIAAGTTAAVMLESARIALGIGLAHERTSRETPH